MVCWLCKCHQCVNDFIIVFNHAISCTKTRRWEWERVGGGTRRVMSRDYFLLIFDFLFNPEMQMFAKIPSTVMCWHEKRKKMNNQLLFCKRKEWYTDICQVLLMRSLFLRVSYGFFPFCYGFTFSVLWYDVWWLLFRHIRFNILDSIFFDFH